MKTYAILAIHFNEADWMEKIKTKVWFKPKYEEALNQALERAGQILNMKCSDIKKRMYGAGSHQGLS